MTSTPAVEIAGTAVARTTPGRSWRCGEQLGQGGQARVYAARELVGSERAALDALAKSIKELGGVRYGHEDREGVFGLALQRFLEIDATERHVVKVYVPRADSERENAWQRLDAEVSALSKVQHPNVIKVVDSGALSDGQRFAVFPRYRRGSVVGHQAGYVGQPLPCLRAALELLDAAAALHAQGFIHRDIKPENVLVDDDGQLVLADLGLVFDRERAESLTRAGEHVGNWQFGPDWGYQDASHQKDPRQDLYAIAKVLWWLASGKAHLRREDWSHVTFDLTKLHPAVPSMVRINEVLAKALADHPDRVQYADAAAMRDDVRSLITELETGRHSSSRPPAGCRACQSGEYSVRVPSHMPGADAFRCAACGHLVWYERTAPVASVPAAVVPAARESADAGTMQPAEPGPSGASARERDLEAELARARSALDAVATTERREAAARRVQDELVFATQQAKAGVINPGDGFLVPRLKTYLRAVAPSKLIDIEGVVTRIGAKYMPNPENQRAFHSHVASELLEHGLLRVRPEDVVVAEAESRSLGAPIVAATPAATDLGRKRELLPQVVERLKWFGGQFEAIAAAREGARMEPMRAAAKEFVVRALGDAARERVHRAVDLDATDAAPLKDKFPGGGLDYLCAVHARALRRLWEGAQPEQIRDYFEMPPPPEV